MQSAIPLACFLSMIRPPGVQFENSLLQIAPVDKAKCPFMKDHNDMEFRLYTRHNPVVYQELYVDNDEKLFASHMDFHAPTVFFFHAFMENADDGSAARVREAYILRGDTNVIMVDASRLEAGPWYFTAAENTWYIGKFAAKFIDFLVSRGLDLKKTHLVGHSLGAQAAGVAGASLKSGRVARITGLDPALPLFAGLPLEQRLDKSDADFVDVIHTDAGIFGVNEPVGHADFYPNGGISPQPGCELEVVIPQQMLLNKCENTKQTTGFLTIHLTPHRITKTTHKLQNSLLKLFIQILFKPYFEQDHQILQVDKNAVKFSIDKTSPNPEQNKEEKGRINEEDQIMAESVAKHSVTLNNKERNVVTKKPIIKKKSHNTGLHVDMKSIGGVESKIKHTKNEKAIENAQHKEKEHARRGDNQQFGSNQSKQVQVNQQDDNDQSKQGHENQQTESDKSKQAQEIQQLENFQTRHGQENQQLEKDQSKQAQAIQQDENDQSKLGQENKQGENDQSKQAQKNQQHENSQDKLEKSHVTKRQKRFINPFQRSESEVQDNFLFRILGFLFNQGKNIPVYSIMREINTLVRSGQGELNHVLKERNNFIGAPPPVIPVSYSLELGNENKALAFMKRLLGFAPKGDRLTINGAKK